MFPIRFSSELRCKGTALFFDFGGMFPYSVGENPYQRVGVSKFSRKLPGAPLLKESEIGLLHAVAVDGAEVVAHGNDMIAGPAPLLAQFERLLTVGVVAPVVIGNKHEGRRTVVGITQGVIVHGDVAAAKSVLVRMHSECLTGDVFALPARDASAARVLEGLPLADAPMLVCDRAALAFGHP